jgi:hypothetical protein
MPFENEETAMHNAINAVGPLLFALPDGEVGEKTAAFPRGTRSSWVNFAIESLHADTENWRVVREPVRGPDGWPANYTSFQHLEGRHSPEELANRVHFGYDKYFHSSYATFKKLRAERGLNALKFQMGVPTGAGLGFAFATPEEGLRYRDVTFNTVLAREVNAALAEAGDDMIVQIEVPPELFFAYQFPDMVEILSLAPIFDLLGKLTPGAQVGIHLCLGDFHHESILHPGTLNTMVDFANRIVKGWPAQHKLVYMHFPFAEGSIPPTTDAAHYEPLAGVHLPSDTRFIAGFVHEDRTLGELKSILGAIEAIHGHRVDIATSCGLGRRSPEVANTLFKSMTELANA